ncbi:MAG: FAD-dependent oxidoreductase [Promethearchaeota archaeon]
MSTKIKNIANGVKEAYYITNNCLIIGGEIAALRAASDLAALGIPVTLVNSSKELGGNTKILQKDFSENFINKDIHESYLEALESNPQATILNNAQITKVVQNHSPFEVEVQHEGTIQKIIARTVILAMGFEPFDASKLREYRYGTIDGLMTIADLEDAFKKKNTPINEKTERVVFVLCAGSRTLRKELKANPDCSSFCCNYAINQALRIKKEFPDVEVILMYMDIRTMGNHEFLYNEARRAGVLFIRGRPSMVNRINSELMIDIENSLARKYESLSADLVVLAIGGIPTPNGEKIAADFGVQLTSNKFIKITEKPVKTSTPGVFACGSACEGVKNISQSLSEGGAAAMAVFKFLKEIEK